MSGFTKVKNVEMKDYQGNDILVTGILHGNIVVGCGVRKMKDPKEKTTANGKIITGAMADVQLFAASNVSDTDENGYVAATLSPITKAPVSVSYMQYKDNKDSKYGEIFVGSLFDGEVVWGTKKDNVMKLSDFFSKEIINSIDQALLTCYDEKIQRSKNSRFASLAADFANSINTTKVTTQKQETATKGKTIEDVLP